MTSLLQESKVSVPGSSYPVESLLLEYHRDTADRERDLEGNWGDGNRVRGAAV